MKSNISQSAPFDWKGIARAWNRFWFQKQDLRIFGVIRIGYAILLLINVLMWGKDLELWFGESGMLPLAASRAVIDQDCWTIFSILPQTPQVLWIAYGLLIAHLLCVLFGIFSRVQMVAIFFWLVNFQHRNLLIFDGEDSLFRLMAFYLIFCPLDGVYSLTNRKSKVSVGAILPLRLIQIQMTVIYLSTALEKLNGHDWISGNAFYYVSHLDDLFGKFPLPGFVFGSIAVSKVLTRGVLLVECFLPIGLWFKETRNAALMCAICLHLGLEYSMNLFLFQWLMLVGLLSFFEFPAFLSSRQVPRDLAGYTPP